jgi:hypothetical protein
MRDFDTRVAALDDYVTGSMQDHDAAAFEEALFDEAAQGKNEEAAYFDEIRRSMRFVGRHGIIGRSFTRAQVDELSRKERMHIVELSLDRTNELEPWGDDIEVVVTHVPVDLRGTDTADVVVERPDGTHIKTFRDIGYDPADGSLFAYCEAPLARIALFSGPTVTRVIAERDGKRSQVAVFHASPRLG